MFYLPEYYLVISISKIENGKFPEMGLYNLSSSMPLSSMFFQNKHEQFPDVIFKTLRWHESRKLFNLDVSS